MGKCKLFRGVKQKIKAFGPLQYLRELSVVIIGVAVTFGVSSWISDTKEEKDMNLQLNAIYTELDKNLTKIEQTIEMHNNHKLFGSMLTKYLSDPQEQYKDSLESVFQLVNGTFSFNYHRGAYEMFINSGAMKRLTDRDLLLNITESYIMLQDTKDEMDQYNVLRTNEIQKLYDTDIKRVINDEGLDVTSKEFRGLANFYISVSMGRSSREAKKQIEKVLSERRKKQ